MRHFLSFPDGAHDDSTLGAKLETLTDLHWKNIRLNIPAVVNRTTGKSMGEHAEEMAKEWRVSRQAQDEWALEGHRRAIAARKGLFRRPHRAS